MKILLVFLMVVGLFMAGGGETLVLAQARYDLYATVKAGTQLAVTDFHLQYKDLDMDQKFSLDDELLNFSGVTFSSVTYTEILGVPNSNLDSPYTDGPDPRFFDWYFNKPADVITTVYINPNVWTYSQVPIPPWRGWDGNFTMGATFEETLQNPNANYTRLIKKGTSKMTGTVSTPFNFVPGGCQLIFNGTYGDGTEVELCVEYVKANHTVPVKGLIKYHLVGTGWFKSYPPDTNPDAGSIYWGIVSVDLTGAVNNATGTMWMGGKLTTAFIKNITGGNVEQYYNGNGKIVSGTIKGAVLLPTVP